MPFLIFKLVIIIFLNDKTIMRSELTIWAHHTYRFGAGLPRRRPPQGRNPFLLISSCQDVVSLIWALKIPSPTLVWCLTGKSTTEGDRQVLRQQRAWKEGGRRGGRGRQRLLRSYLLDWEVELISYLTLRNVFHCESCVRKGNTNRFVFWLRYAWAIL